MTGKLYRTEEKIFTAHKVKLEDNKGNKGEGVAWTKKDAEKIAERDYKDNKLLRGE